MVPSNLHPAMEKATSLLTTEEVFSAPAQGKYFLITQQQLGRMCQASQVLQCEENKSCMELSSATRVLEFRQLFLLRSNRGHVAQLQRLKCNRPECRASG